MKAIEYQLGLAKDSKSRRLCMISGTQAGSLWRGGRRRRRGEPGVAGRGLAVCEAVRPAGSV